MKIVPKFQEGGYMSLFNIWTPAQAATTSEQESRSSSSKEESSEKDNTKGKITKADIVKELVKLDALPNDINMLANRFYGIFETTSITEDGVADLSSEFMTNLSQIKLIALSKKQYDKVYEKLYNNGGLEELAITSNGYIMALDKDDKIQQISVSQYLSSNNQYKPITNSNLLYLRAYQPEYTYNNELLNIANNGIGINEVDKMIRERMMALGTIETVRSGYSVKANNQIIQGIQVLSQLDSYNLANQTGMTLDGLYNNKIITKDQKQQADAALAYIYNSLPTNAKTLLAVKAGNAKDPKAGALDFIQQLITAKSSSTISQTTEYKGSLDTVMGKKGNSDSGDSLGSDDIKTDPYYNMSRMIGGNPTNITLNKGTNYEMSVNGTNYPSIPGFDGKPIGRTSLENLLVSGLQGVVTDKNAISFGNVVLSGTDFDNIMYDGSGGTMAILPTKISDNGRKVVDLESLDRWETANTQLRQMGINSIYDPNHQSEIVQVLHNNNLDQLIDLSTGGVDYSSFGQYLILDGYAVDSSSKNKFKNSTFVTKVDDDSDIIPIIEKTLSTDKDQSNYKIDVNNWYDWNGHDTVYQGSIYIPITSNQLQALTAGGQHIKEGPATQKEADFQMLEKRLAAKQPSLNLL